MPRQRYVNLVQHLSNKDKEALFEEVEVRCSLTDEADVVRCFDPVTMNIGEPPLLTSRIFERWHGAAWVDHSEL